MYDANRTHGGVYCKAYPLSSGNMYSVIELISMLLEYLSFMQPNMCIINTVESLKVKIYARNKSKEKAICYPLRYERSNSVYIGLQRKGKYQYKVYSSKTKTSKVYLFISAKKKAPLGCCIKGVFWAFRKPCWNAYKEFFLSKAWIGGCY